MLYRATAKKCPTSKKGFGVKLQNETNTTVSLKTPYVKALTHCKDFHKDFSKNSLGKLLSIYKTIGKIVAVVKKVVVCMDNNYFFLQFQL